MEEFLVQMAASSPTVGLVGMFLYDRIKRLEKKMDKHNNLVERVAVLEATSVVK